MYTTQSIPPSDNSADVAGRRHENRITPRDSWNSKPRVVERRVPSCGVKALPLTFNSSGTKEIQIRCGIKNSEPIGRLFALRNQALLDRRPRGGIRDSDKIHIGNLPQGIDGVLIVVVYQRREVFLVTGIQGRRTLSGRHIVWG